MKGPRCEAGFTLIEVVVTCMVLGTMFLGVFGLFSTLRSLNARANTLTIATEAAQQQLEQYRNKSYAAIPVGTVDTTAQLSGYPQLGTRASSVVVSQEDARGLKRVVASVSYTERGRTRQVALTTLIALNGLDR